MPPSHNASFKALNMEKVYVPIRVPMEQLEDFMSYCRGFGLRGLSVTIPHKEAILSYVDSTDRDVDHIGAVHDSVADSISVEKADELHGWVLPVV